jgi:hypothetical protein
MCLRVNRVVCLLDWLIFSLIGHSSTQICVYIRSRFHRPLVSGNTLLKMSSTRTRGRGLSTPRRPEKRPRMDKSLSLQRLDTASDSYSTPYGSGCMSDCPVCQVLQHLLRVNDHTYNEHERRTGAYWSPPATYAPDPNSFWYSPVPYMGPDGSRIPLRLTPDVYIPVPNTAVACTQCSPTDLCDACFRFIEQFLS